MTGAPASAAIVPDLLRERAGEDPGAVALRVGDSDALTYGQWEARSNAAARQWPTSATCAAST